MSHLRGKKGEEKKESARKSEPGVTPGIGWIDGRGEPEEKFRGKKKKICTEDSHPRKRAREKNEFHFKALN